MLEIVEVKTRKQRKEFVEYPLRLYKGNPYFVPPPYGDEMAMFTDKNIYKKTCDSVFYLAVKDGKTVGRIQGIPASTVKTTPPPPKPCSTPSKTGEERRL